MSYYYVPAEGGLRPLRVHFSQDDQQYYTVGFTLLITKQGY